MRIKHRSKLFAPLIFFTVLLILTACGGGGGDGEEHSDPLVKTANVTIGILRKDHTEGLNIGSVSLNITLPSSFVLPIGADDIPISTKALVDGLLVDVGSHYAHPTLTLALIRGTAFSTGDLVSFSRPLQNGEALPSASTFSLDLIEVSEVSGNDVTIHTEEYEVTLTIEEI